MIINVYSLNKALGASEKKDFQNWISIRDKYECDPETGLKHAAMDRHFNKHHANSIIVRFDDIDPYRFKYGMEHECIKKKFASGAIEPTFFSREHAIQIVDFVKGIWDKNHDAELNIHCWAGRSRSQAVGYWLNIYFNLIIDRNIEHYVRNNATNIHEKVHFNCEVLRVFSETFG